MTVERRARLSRVLLLATFPIVVAAIAIGYAVHPDNGEQSEKLSFALVAPVGLALIARGALLRDGAVRDAAERLQGWLPEQPPPTVGGAVASVVIGLIFLGLAASAIL